MRISGINGFHAVTSESREGPNEPQLVRSLDHGQKAARMSCKGLDLPPREVQKATPLTAVQTRDGPGRPGVGDCAARPERARGPRSTLVNLKKLAVLGTKLDSRSLRTTVGKALQHDFVATRIGKEHMGCSARAIRRPRRVRERAVQPVR